MSVLPRKGSLMHGIMQTKGFKVPKSISRFKLANKYLVVPLYRINILPLFFFGRIFLLLYTLGRKSGKRRITPLEYRKKDGKIYIFASRGKFSDWYRNLLAHPDEIKVKIGFRKHNCTIRTLNQEEKYVLMEWYSNKFPKAAQAFYGYNKEVDELSEEFLSPITNYMEIVELTFLKSGK